MLGDRIDLAEEIIERCAVLFENYFGYHWILGYYHMYHEDYNAAIISFNRSQDLSPAITSIERQIMFCKGKLGDRAQVESYIKSQTGHDAETYVNLASAYSGLDDSEKTIKYLKLLAEFGHSAPSEVHNVKFRQILLEENDPQLLNELTQLSTSVH